MADNATSTPSLQDATTAVDRVRQTAQWLTAGVGALSAVLVASLKLSDVSKLSDDARVFAIVGISLGLVGSLTALLAMAWVLGPLRVRIADVALDARLLDEIE